MSPSLKKVLEEAVQIVNFIKSRPLQNRILCSCVSLRVVNIKSYCCIQRLLSRDGWLSRGKILDRVFESKRELMSYFRDKKFHLSNRLKNPDWLSRLAYLADIFSELNETCSFLQGKELSVFQAQDKIISLSRKLQFWSSDVGKKTFRCFQHFSDLIEDSGEDLPDKIFGDIENHLSSLIESLHEYFPKLHSKILLGTESF